MTGKELEEYAKLLIAMSTRLLTGEMRSSAYLANVQFAVNKMQGVDAAVSLAEILKPSSGRTQEQLDQDYGELDAASRTQDPLTFYSVTHHDDVCGKIEHGPYVIWIENLQWFAARPDAMASFGAGLCPEDAMQNCRLRLIKEKMDRDAEMSAMGF